MILVDDLPEQLIVNIKITSDSDIQAPIYHKCINMKRCDDFFDFGFQHVLGLDLIEEFDQEKK